MTTLKINIPENIDVNHFEVEMYLATKWYEQGKLSSGQAAEMVGLSKRTFIELLGKYGVSVFGYDINELENELKNVIN